MIEVEGSDGIVTDLALGMKAATDRIHAFYALRMYLNPTAQNWIYLEDRASELLEVIREYKQKSEKGE